MAKPFDPNDELFHVMNRIPDSEGPKWIVIFDSIPKEYADRLASDLKRRPGMNPEDIKVVPRFHP